MIETSLSQFLESLKSLEKYINYHRHSSTYINLALKNGDLSDPLKLFNQTDLATKKSFDYRGYIISLYGMLERYLEDLLQEYLENTQEIFPKYHDLPNEIKKNNISLNNDLLKNIDLPKNSALSISNIVKKLNDNLNNNISNLNIEAFTKHTFNFRVNTIEEFFKRAGITGIFQRIRKIQPLHTILADEFISLDRLKSNVLFSFIDEIAERRNEVAHGTDNIEVLSTQIILEYLEKFRCFGISLNQLVKSHFLMQKTNGVKEHKLIDVFNKRIACLAVSDIKCDMNSTIVIRNKNAQPEFNTSKIIDMQVNNNSVHKIDTDTEIKIGLKLDIDVHRSSIIYIL
ncbi:MAE_28990/MAE_18760 family HEPN-like nuclease [Catenovulum sp. 2E275]|uniref:MAE_28990/MAE_18760 family HEPN-like nuclease n=1 Tax=Catenovulum sp. 2E275 TaxID=2980497 RepID=UPI0021D0E016|nr:MAE_28990/MAE_18760 family HEPN-like nuclease [Catenovulum sp. 2E275]MCU4676038.1 MAE_28990/MAE_18760 family HEPN-like nuclease [Catenovulum sp. 2E275]